MSEISTELDTFMVRLQKYNILVPNVTVAEIIPYEPLQRVEDSPDWFLGFLGWRGIEVPVASFEMMTLERVSFSLVSVSSASLVVLWASGGETDFDYMAIVAQAMPQTIKVTAEELFEIGEPVEKTELMKVRYADQLVSIPDFDFIDSEIRRVAFSKSP